MVYTSVCSAVNKLKKKYKENDPIKLCEAMGINLMPMSFGTAPDCIKGYYTCRYRIKTIVYNCDLPRALQSIVIFHEIGHSVLHNGEGIATFSDVTMYDTNSRAENEANLFAAEYMLDDDTVIGILNSDTTFFGAAAQLNVPVEFLDFKFRVLRWKGLTLSKSPIDAGSRFLKNLEVEDFESYPFQ